MEVNDYVQIPNWATTQLVESKYLAEELSLEGSIIFYEDSITLHCENYQKDSSNILLQCISIKGENVIETWGSKIEIKTINPSEVMEVHRATSEALSHTVDDQEKENVGIK